MSQTLSEAQSAALFDILSHYNTYAEIRDFRHPQSLQSYGPPFKHSANTPSTSPSLQSLVSRFVLNLPGLRDLSGGDFWTVQIQDIIDNLEAAELSESYDKGGIGSRKTLATAVSALIEYPVRGTHGGFAKVDDVHVDYDLGNAQDLNRAFRDFLDRVVYGDILDEVVQKTAETDRLEDHDPLIQAVHEFVLVNVASLMHYTLILTPKGQYLVKLIDNINKLVPYMVIRQTLKIGNVATMVNAMVRVVLAKMSVASITNWIGLTQTEDEGMNLLQQIISTVLSWDNRDLESRASKIEKEKNGVSKQQLQALKEYQNKTREDHERIRKTSQQESISIVMAILNDASVSADNLTGNDTVHKSALDYLSIQLSIRDRKEIIRILCHSIPDHLTTSVRNGVSAYEPVIRQLHDAVDLSDTVYDFETFLRDLLKLSKVQPADKSGKSAVPTVGDFVQLLKKHQYSLHKFLHQVCKNGKEVTGWYQEWAKTTASHFRRKNPPSDSGGSDMQTGAGDLSDPLNELFSNLPTDKQDGIIKILDTQIQYLDEMNSSSTRRLASVLASAPSKNPAIAKVLAASASSRPGSRPASRPASRQGSRAPSPAGVPSNDAKDSSSTTKSNNLQPNTNPDPASVAIDPSKLSPKPQEKSNAPAPSIDSNPGPGAFLARWQDLLESTPITPLTAKGKVNSASSKQVIQNSTTDVDGDKTAEFADGKSGAEKVTLLAEEGTTSSSGGRKLKKPDARLVIECLGDSFRKLLAEGSCYW